MTDEGNTGPATSRRIATELSNYQVQIDNLDRDITEIQERIQERKENLVNVAREPAGNQRQSGETERQFLIRTGKITPFAKGGPEIPFRSEDNLNAALLNAETGPEETEPPQSLAIISGSADARSHRVLQRPGFVDRAATPAASNRGSKKPPAKKRRVDREGSQTTTRDSSVVSSSRTSPDEDGDGSFTPSTGSVVEQLAVGESDEDSGDDSFIRKHVPAMTARKGKGMSETAATINTNDLDDGNEKIYQARLQSWVTRRKEARESAGTATTPTEEGDEEWTMPHPTNADMELEGGFRIPGDVHPSLFDYQKTGVQWLWELYSQHVGGIVGDEMGLGKTIQVIAFLAGLHYSKKVTRPTIIVAPATVMKQWVNEFHVWWPPFRVSILHSTGSGMVDLGREARREDDLLDQTPGKRSKANAKSQRAAQKIVDRVVDQGHVLVTTYSGLQTYAEQLLPVVWECAVLDEGHKIRNPNAALTLFCKELRTPNRVILSGTPMQNNLMELWSLFDFVFPMRLGSLVDFKAQFEIPVRIGGYANASNLQIQTANKCAEALKDAISPYLLQRVKADVASDLPKKTERVLFCRLTKPQREAYESFLAGDDMRSIYSGKRNVLYGVDMLRKICNHPDLQDHRGLSAKPDYKYGAAAKSGKMVIVKELLDIWTRGGHKTLLFAQHRIMLDILEKYIQKIEGIKYRRMDGTTPIAARQSTVDAFNTDPSIHVFLLTTKVGGLGVNLTGADRVIIFDPDWNPSTDIQARERAWRLGQKREVEIYRLMVAGTIEEKVFHRQVFKQFLTNKILRDPKQRQTFQMQDLHDLFSLGRADEAATETSQLFQGSEVRFDEKETAKEAAQIEELEGVSSLRPMGLSGGAEGNGASEGESTAAEAASTGSSRDERIMAGLFARSGVHSALEHDKIVNGRRVVAADLGMVEREAKRIAADAAKELKKAEAVARSVPAGQPTWTGQFGTTGRPSVTGGPSSATILAGLQNSSAAAAAQGAPARVSVLQRRRERAGKDFAKQIRDFLTVHGGRVYTQMILDHFNRFVGPELVPQFKAVLNELATLQKGRNGRGSWVLKDEYKT